MGVTIAGHEKLAQLAARLDALARNDLRDKIGLAIWYVVDPLRKDARAHARAILPRRGGLNEVVANTAMPVTMNARGRWRGVRIRVTADRENMRDPGAVNRGRVRHPVYGRVREPGGEPLIQMVQVGWFTTPMEAGAGQVRAEIMKVIDSELAKLG